MALSRPFLCLRWAVCCLRNYRPPRSFQSPYGISGNVLSWFASYITSRIHTAILNGQSSRPVDVFFGVPQSSVSGPIFFILFSVPHYSLTEAETSELCSKTGFQSAQTPLYAPSSSSFSLVTSPNQNRLQNSQRYVTTHLLSLTISLCTLFPNNFVFRQTRVYYVTPMLRQKPLANAVSLTVAFSSF